VERLRQLARHASMKKIQFIVTLLNIDAFLSILIHFTPLRMPLPPPMSKCLLATNYLSCLMKKGRMMGWEGFHSFL
jgi:hypothetical protein